MTLVRQSLRTRPPFGEFGDPPLPGDGRVLFEEEFYRAHHVQQVQQQQQQQQQQPAKPPRAEKRKETKRVLKTSSRKELAYADHVERLLIDSADSLERLLEASTQKQHRRRSLVSSSSTSSHAEKPSFIDDDRFLEKLMAKFETVRTRGAPRLSESSSDEPDEKTTFHGIERIVERRYYLKRVPEKPKRDQLTSTTDLTMSKKKYRLSSGVSSVTAASSACSRCESDLPGYVEVIREQSELLRHDFSELKSDIENLLSSQQDFFRQLQTQIPAQAGLRTAVTNLAKASSNQKPSASPITGEKSRSISTESLASTETAGTTSEASTPVTRPTTIPTSAGSKPPITEFMANKSPSFVPAPPVVPHSNSKSPPLARTPPANAPVLSKPPLASSANSSRSSSKAPSITSASPIRLPLTQSKAPLAIPNSSARPPPGNSKTSSIVSASPAHPSQNTSKASSIAPTPPINPPTTAALSRPAANAFVPVQKLPAESAPSPSVDSRASSVTPASPRAASPPSPKRTPVYENEVAFRRVLSPRSQIVASAASFLGSSASSTGSVSSIPTELTQPTVSKISTAALRANDLQELARYSSQLELSGFPPAITPVFTNPNTNSTFWDSVDDYIETSKATDTLTTLTPVQRTYYGSTFGLDPNASKQLDKYDLEIRPQDGLTPTAPLLMPPWDIAP